MMTAIETGGAGASSDEAALIAAAQGGNANCFGTLLSRYEGKIFWIANNITHNESDAEEVTQDAFWKAFQHIEDFKGDSRFYTWLVRIAINQALTNLRGRRLYDISLDSPTDTEADFIPRDVKDKRLTPEERYSQTELAEILITGIEGLNPTLRITFQLREVENVSTEETANRLGLSVPAVKSRVLRARMQLREALSARLRKGPRSSSVSTRSTGGPSGCDNKPLRRRICCDPASQLRSF